MPVELAHPSRLLGVIGEPVLRSIIVPFIANYENILRNLDMASLSSSSGNASMVI